MRSRLLAVSDAYFSSVRCLAAERFPCVSKNWPGPRAGFEAGFFVSEISTSRNQLIDRERRAGSGRWCGPAPDSIAEFWRLHLRYKWVRQTEAQIAGLDYPWTDYRFPWKKSVDQVLREKPSYGNLNVVLSRTERHLIQLLEK